MLHNLLLQFHRFPGAESIHLAQGLVAGWLLVSGYIHQRAERVAIALVLLAGFCVYETLEQWRIGDNGDLDVSAFLIAMWLSAIMSLAIYLGVEAWRNHRR